ncbi:MAG: bifunctional riboflavin kinase/FAD synthetase [Dehalococcoidia bacterium]
MTDLPGRMDTALAREELSRCGSAARGRESAVTIGKFDGVHRGHQFIVQRLLELAAAEGLASVVVTFNPHPVTVLRPGTPIAYLCSLEERVELLRGLGVDSVAILSFTSQLAQLSARDFVSLLREQLGMRLLLVGPDFALGRNREGDIERLRALGDEHGYRLEVAPMLTEPDRSGEKVGSRAIRAALAQGQMGAVARLLGRPFSLRGPVVPGAARGKALGFPTANLGISPDLALPALGIYVTRAYLCGNAYPSVTSIGVRPTFAPQARPTVEAYILDFEDDLYGQEMSLEVLHRLRDEEEFASVEDLVEAIKGDVEAGREYFRAQG